MRKIIRFVLVICLCLVILTGCSGEEEYSMSDKITEEIKYMENKMIEIVNNFALGNYEMVNSNINDNTNTMTNDDVNTDTEADTNLDINASVRNLNFDEILKDTRKVEEASNRMMVDLAIENVDNGEITRLSDGINNMLGAVDSGDEMTYLVELNNVFSLFSNYEAKISNDSDEIFERRLKYFTISSYISFLVGDKELAKTQVETLENEYLEKQKGVEYVEEHKYNLNKIYLLIEELKKSIEADSENLVREKYLLLINEI